jgi:hypothetical protein
VNPAEAYWHGGFGLAANTDYLIKPRPNSIYTINGGITGENFHGSAWTDGSAIGVGQIRLGGLAVLVWHHQADGTAVAQIISFPPGKNYAYAVVGPHGGSIHFLIGDVPGTYADNSGVCEVDVILDDESDVIRPVYPIIAEDNHVHKGYAKWTVGDTGFVLAHLKGTHSGISGSAKFSTRLILVNKFGSPIYATDERTLTVGADAISGTNTKTKDWSDFPTVPTNILKTARGAIVQLARDTGSGSLVDQAEQLAKEFKRLETVYKTFKDSEIVKDIALAIAAG